MGPLATLAALMPLRKANDVRQVEPGAKAGDTTGDTRHETAQAARAAEARDVTALRRERERRDLPAGPPPSFQISQLEVDADIKQIIARVEAARTRAREAEGMKARATPGGRPVVFDAAGVNAPAASGPFGAETPGTQSTAPEPSDLTGRDRAELA